MTHNAPTVSVGEKRKVGEASPVSDVGNIGHDQFTRTLRHEFRLCIEQVFIAMEPVPTVSGLRAQTPLTQH
ncbi:hypothetical protein HQ47_06835 [Porphyromonas macacae]|uniref:Uncharacterized protein n=1 Tax=Porphyromonas macacae TaxID=28115 RepID=A0A0A2E7M1_9PORP|nr:hypothetical protein HQ47_06835 [Porphyromonas macacae]